MTKDARTISLQHWLSYIESIHSKAIDFDLERVREVAQKAELLPFRCPVILVAGTNGKGSTVALLSKLLQNSGLRVGSYFSPHLVYFNERIVLNSQPCPEYLLCHAFAKIEKARGKTPLTYFEFTTLAAFEIFHQGPLDVLVLEIGCGGEKDAVNIVEPTISVITAIDKDHTELLGSSIDEIALAKAGILRPNQPAVIGQKAQLPVLLERAKQLKSDCILEGEDFGWHDIHRHYWQYQKHYLKIPRNPIPSESVSISLAAFKLLEQVAPQLGALSLNQLETTLRQAHMPGRFQRIQNHRCETFLDAAHNVAGAQWLASQLVKEPNSGRTIGVWASFKDKDLSGIVGAMQEYVDEWVIAPSQNPRTASIEALETVLKEQGIEKFHSQSTLSCAYHKAETLCTRQDRIVVFGSFATVGEVLHSLGHDYPYASTFYVKPNFTFPRTQSIES